MSPDDAKSLVQSLTDKDGCWLDKTHVATDTLRRQAIIEIDFDDDEDGGAYGGDRIVCIEIQTREPHPHIDRFAGIAYVNKFGIWFYDGDGSVEEPCWRSYLIPWHMITSVVMHQVS